MADIDKYLLNSGYWPEKFLDKDFNEPNVVFLFSGSGKIFRKSI